MLQKLRNQDDTAMTHMLHAAREIVEEFGAEGKCFSTTVVGKKEICDSVDEIHGSENWTRLKIGTINNPLEGSLSLALLF